MTVLSDSVHVIAFRASDRFVAAGSHGRGTFTGYVDVSGSVSNESGIELPTSVTLDQNYPNPFNPSTTIEYELASPGTVTLQVFDASGRLVDVLARGSMSAGAHSATWNGRNIAGTPVASGTYFYRLTVVGANGIPLRSESKQMTFLK